MRLGFLQSTGGTATDSSALLCLVSVSKFVPFSLPGPGSTYDIQCLLWQSNIVTAILENSKSHKSTLDSEMITLFLERRIKTSHCISGGCVVPCVRHRITNYIQRGLYSLQWYTFTLIFIARKPRFGISAPTERHYDVDQIIASHTDDLFTTKYHTPLSPHVCAT